MSGGRNSGQASKTGTEVHMLPEPTLSGLQDPRFSCGVTSVAVTAMSRRGQKGFVQQAN